jgi:hypothetical protein
MKLFTVVTITYRIPEFSRKSELDGGISNELALGAATKRTAMGSIRHLAI